MQREFLVARYPRRRHQVKAELKNKMVAKHVVVTSEVEQDRGSTPRISTISFQIGFAFIPQGPLLCYVMA